MGDAACHLGSTCLNCGKFVGDELAVQGQCPHCGAGPDGLVDDGGLFGGPGMSPTAANLILYCDSGRPPSSSIATPGVGVGMGRRVSDTGDRDETASFGGGEPHANPKKSHKNPTQGRETMGKGGN